MKFFLGPHGIIFGSSWGHFQVIMGSFLGHLFLKWDHFRVIMGWFSGHHGVIWDHHESFSGHHRIIFGSSWGHCWVILVCFYNEFGLNFVIILAFMFVYMKKTRFTRRRKPSIILCTHNTFARDKAQETNTSLIRLVPKFSLTNPWGSHASPFRWPYSHAAIPSAAAVRHQPHWTIPNVHLLKKNKQPQKLRTAPRYEYYGAATEAANRPKT